MKKVAVLLILSLLVVSHSTIAGPISELYVTQWQNQGLSVVQGSSVLRSWNSSGNSEISIAVIDNTVRTYAHTKGNIGAEYDGLTGQFTGTLYSSSSDPRGAFHEHDGASDGTFLYGVDHDTGNVWQYDSDWSNPNLLFNTSRTDLGITYDSTNNSLWIGGWGSGLITNYALDGTVLSSFNAVGTHVSALAFDAADGTLWATSSGGSTFFQYSRQGAQLGSQAYSISGSIYGAEFSVSSTVPEPTSALLLALAIFAVRRRCTKRN